MKKSEKTLVGLMMIVGGIALVVGVGLPQWDAFSNNSSRISTLNDEIKGLQVQKENLNATIALLEKNTAIPPGLEIRRYTDQNREEIIKSLLDGVVKLATGAGNRFISLTPSEVAPILAPPPPPKEGAGTKGATNTNAAASTDPNAAPAAPPPLLSTFGYELAIRGTYDSLQGFLRAMDSQKELLELSSITLENEASKSGKGPDDTADPHFPIRLTAKVRLALQPARQ